MTDTIDSKDLLGLRNWDLAHRAPNATHQHFKGGLYQFVWLAQDCDDPEYERVAYFHLHPYEKELWLRKSEEFYGLVDTPEWHPEYGNKKQIKRFRKLGEGW